MRGVRTQGVKSREAQTDPNPVGDIPATPNNLALRRAPVEDDHIGSVSSGMGR